MQAAGYGAYQRIQAETSSPAQLVALLYNALLTDLKRSEQALAARDLELASNRLVHAQDIVLELLASIDHSVEGELPRQLSGLYEYMYQRLVHANVRKDAAIVREVTELIRPIAEAWVNVAQSPTALEDGARQ